MPICDYCGEHFTFGALKVGSYKFCSGNCRDKGRILEILDSVPPRQVTDYIISVRNDNCPSCGGNGPIDIRPSYRVYSVGLYTSWKTVNKIECRACARKRQLSDFGYCLAAGWWGLPWGFVLTPIQVIRNLVAMHYTSSFSTYRFMQIAKLNLARRLIEDVKPPPQGLEPRSIARPEVDFGPWERLTDPSITSNELCREYNFKNLAGPSTTTHVELRCRLTVKDTPAGRTVTPFVFLVFAPYLLEQTEIVTAIFGPDDDLINYKVLAAKIEAAATGINFVVFDEADGEHLLDILMLGRRLSLQLIRQSGEHLGRIPLENDHTFRTEYELFKSELLAGRKREGVHQERVRNVPINNLPHDLPGQNGMIWLDGDEIWFSQGLREASIEGRPYQIPGGTITFPNNKNGRESLLKILRTQRDLWAPGNEAALIKSARKTQV